MGMFDYVKYEAPCWKCGAQLKDWQTKDTECLLQEVKPEDCRKFYTMCDVCKNWNEYEVKPTAFVIVPADKREDVDRCATCHRPFDVGPAGS